MSLETPMNDNPMPNDEIDHITFNSLCSEGRRDELWERVFLSYSKKLFQSIQRKFHASLDEFAVLDIISDRIADTVKECRDKPIKDNLGGYLYWIVEKRYLSWLKREGRLVHLDAGNKTDEGEMIDPFGGSIAGTGPRLDPSTPDSELEAAQTAACIHHKWMPFVRGLRTDQLDLVTSLYLQCSPDGQGLSEKERYGAYLQGFEPTAKRTTPRTEQAFKEAMSKLKMRFKERVLVPCGIS